MKYCFVFVCQQGELEIKALLLAASLKRNLCCEHELIVGIPEPFEAWGRPSALATQLLAELGVRLVPIVNPIGIDYPIGNKLACLGIETDADKIVFLDSDMLCLRKFTHHARFELAFNAKPADLATFSLDDDQWRRAYAVLGLPPPISRVIATASGQLMQPYFNAGFIAVNRNLGFAETWIEAACGIDRDDAITNKRPWLDQIALPVALAKHAVPFDCLDERYNYPAHIKPLNCDNLPFFCHYHSPQVLRSEPLADAFVKDLIRETPGIGTLIASIDAAPTWREFLHPEKLNYTARTSAASPVQNVVAAAPKLIITGIPRSGTSYLCKLIHSSDNCIVINEPSEIFALLSQLPLPWGVAAYYRQMRRDILDGKAILNKLVHGEFIEDTAQVDTLEPYHPKVSRADFLLGTKNTLAYLARLPQLKRVMPEAVFVGCVRHPLDTIASWKTSFPHLANADMESQLLGNSRDSQLSGPQRQRLGEIANAVSAAQKRAMMWRYLAETLLDQEQRLLLVHYETMVANPVATLQRIFEALPVTLPLHLDGHIAASAPRYKREVLDDEDLEAISGICAQTAAEFGYNIF